MTLSEYRWVGWAAGLAACLLGGSIAAIGQQAVAAASPAPAAAPAAATPAVAPNGDRIFPLTEVRRGLHGVAYTVFEGVTPEPMTVEILGVLKDAIGPGEDMILARLGGEKAEYTGVVAGMSGSPVYVDGRLVGAISYRIGQFSKEPIAGITPIEQMLQVRDGAATEMRVAGNSQPSASSQLLHSEMSDQSVASNGEVQPIETALVFGGFSQDAVARFGERFRAMGMTPVAGLGGAAAAGTKQPEPLVPGSAVSAVLVRGDLSISGTCTVTYVDPTQLLACGHPITQFGPVAMPMTKAEVVATLASPLNAFKIINTTETVGSFTEDRASAILGRFGVDARMIPVSVQVVPAQVGVAGASAMKHVSQEVERPGAALPVPGTGAPPGTKGGMHFEVLDNRELTPSAMLVSVYQSLSGTNDAASEMSYRMTGELTLKGMPPVRLEGIMAPTESQSGAISAALFVNDRFSRLYENAEEQPEVTGLRLRMEALPERRTAVLEGARLAQTEAHAGETVEVEATLDPYQVEAQVVRMKVRLPDSLSPGPLRVVVSDGATLDRLTGLGSAGAGAIVLQGAGVGQHPIALADAVAKMNRMHPNDRIYVTLLDHTAQVELDAHSLPGIPLSMANVLEPLKAAQKIQLTGESAVETGSVETGYAVTGTQVLTLDVR